jgi:4-hydroxy-2-oxoheptanedioate aldolase
MAASSRWMLALPAGPTRFSRRDGMVSLRDKAKDQGPIFATWIASGSSLSAEIIGRIGYDCVIVDRQHGGISEAELLPVLQVFDGTDTPALVRVNWLDPAQIMRVADLGAAGVVIPMVNKAEDAAKAVAAIRYPPRGLRSFGPVRGGYTATGEREEPLCIVMIETEEALSNLDAIAATPHLDGLLVGPVDLALSLGLGLSLAMPDAVLDAIARVADACRQHGLIAASVSFDPTNAKTQLAKGVTLLASGSDTLFMRTAATANLAGLRQIAGQTPP